MQKAVSLWMEMQNKLKLLESCCRNGIRACTIRYSCCWRCCTYGESKIVEEVMNAVIPLWLKPELVILQARVLESMGVDYIDELKY